MAKNQFTEKAARMYDKYKLEFYDYPTAARNIEKLRRDYEIEDRHVLELGTGTANLALHLAREGFIVDGIDKSPAMIEIAERKLKGRVEERMITISAQRAERLETERRYPVVVSHGLLTFIGIAGGLALMSYIRTLEGNRKAFSRVRRCIEEDPRGLFLINLIPNYRPGWKLQELESGLSYARENEISPYDRGGVAEVVTTHIVRYPDGRRPETSVFRKSLFKRADVERDLRGAGFEVLGPAEHRGFYAARPI